MYRKLRLLPPEHVIKPKHVTVQDVPQKQIAKKLDAGVGVLNR